MAGGREGGTDERLFVCAVEEVRVLMDGWMDGGSSGLVAALVVLLTDRLGSLPPPRFSLCKWLHRIFLESGACALVGAVGAVAISASVMGRGEVGMT